MAGRPSKPTQLIKLEGKSHRTKKELEHREKAEKSLYTGTTFKESPAVKADPVAHREFLRLKKLYKQIQFVDGLDEQIINRYCMLISQEQALAKMMERMRLDVDELESVEERLELYGYIAGVTDKTMKTREMLLKIEDRLFLNPTGRIKSIPKKPEEPPKQSAMAQFMNRRAGGHGT